MRLVLERVSCGYGGAPVLRDLSLQVRSGEVVCLLGRNGAGKTTVLKAILGLVRPVTGRIALDGQALTRLPPYRIPLLGLGYVPQGRRLFPELTVEENLRLGLRLSRGGPWTLARVCELFPVIGERLRQPAGLLSGGEQQMVAIARALCTNPRFLLLDEPLEGLMPLVAQRVLATLGSLAREGMGLLLVEQKVKAALAVADTVLVLEAGRLCFAGSRQEVPRPEALIPYLGARR
ncbi:MAG: ABC transporter ATP-binding protein [Candidatus Tectimicrobiota bacterium]|nr:MAG: ABC transporter ATP-binding protein [Candidatus Tectomicrobia bacterium]